MAYFSNGEQGYIYEDQFCERCVHHPDCPIMRLHGLYNYDQCKNETLATALSIFIPRSTDGMSNEQCKMFIEKKV